MSALADTVLKLMQLGATEDMIRAVIDGHEAAQTEAAPSRNARQERNRRYYENKKQRLNPSEIKTLETNKTGSDGEQKKGLPDPLKENTTPPNHPTDGQAPRGVVVSLPKRESRRAARAAKAPAYTGDFEIFWAEYPRQRNTSKSEAFDVFDRLTPDDQNAAIEGAIAYAGSCRKEQTPDRFIAHATTFLRQRRWECAA